VKQGIDPNALPADAPELLVKLKTEVNAGNWVMGIQNVKLRLLRRVSAENTWLLAFDPKQISAEQLIETLKALPDVLEVQRNKKTSDRN
jgi:allophanate hydrolase subunit 1